MLPIVDMEDRRRLKRRHLLYYLRVLDRDSGEQVGSVVDITRQGVMLISPGPIEPGREFRLRMTLPPGVTPDGRMDLDARSLWTRPDVNPDFHITGFELGRVTPDCLWAIEQLIEDYGFRD